MIIPIGKYFIRTDPDNFMVSTLLPEKTRIAKTSFSDYDNLSYHPKLEDALWSLCKRLVKENKDTVELEQAINIVNAIKIDIKSGAMNAMADIITKLEKENQELKEQLRDLKEI